MKKRSSATGKKDSPTRKPRSKNARSKGAFSKPMNTETIPHGKADQDPLKTSGSLAPTFRMESKRKRYVPFAAIVIILGITSLYFYLDILLRLHNYYTLILVIPLYGYIFGDLFLWLRTGVRSLEMNSDELRVTTPNQPAVRRIGKNEIGSIRVSTTIDGKTVYILLHGARVSRVLWMNFYSGPRVRIPEAPFGKNDFTEFIERLRTMATVIP